MKVPSITKCPPLSTRSVRRASGLLATGIPDKGTDMAGDITKCRRDLRQSENWPRDEVEEVVVEDLD
jgi:hypothetical protein